MLTVEQVAHAALADLGAEAAGLANAIRWVNERISQVASRKMKHRRKIGGLVIPASITAGEITLTNGSEIVKGDATAQSAWNNKKFGGAFLQPANSGIWYPINSYAGGELTLGQPYEGTTTTTSYRIVYRFVELPVEASFLGHFSYNRIRREIRLKSQLQLDNHYPDRTYVTGGPQYYSVFGEQAGKKLLEFYPYSTLDEFVLFTYWENPSYLAKDDIIPTPFTAHDLKTGIHADIYTWQATKETDIQLKAWYSNMAAKAETRWKDTLADIMRRDRTVDDLVLLFKSPRPEMMVNWNAHTEVYFRGNRP